MTSQPFSRRPLRIVVGAVTYPPDVNGAANFGHRLATGLAERGHDVHVICHSTDRQPHVAVENGVTVHRTASYGSPLHPTIRGCLPWQAAARADRLLAEIQPDVVHVQSHFFIGRGLINSARRRGIGLVATNHFMPENIFGYIKVPRALQDAAGRILWHNLVKHYGKAQLVTAPTPRAVQLLRDNGFARPAMPVSCGIDVDRYRRRARQFRKHHPDPEVRTVLFVGRLDEEKHIDDLLRAMSLLRTQAATRLEIVGDGSRRAAFERLAAELGIADRVHFAGFVSDEELLDAYARADVFCMPSIAELQSLATMEAMSAGTPVVLANAMALPHLVKPGQNGWLYPPRDVHALARAIDDIVDDRETIDRMGAASERLVSQHDIDAVLARFEAIYHHVMDPESSSERDEVRAELAS
ncbi:glycosyltransferase [Saccharopolyspora rosea]|uniref:Glycosyltransferase n=1 Tax=Saccharopolyspora rosea TaxID=524884 RepID=A0ABW3FKI9_9PSEU|nr:glycosyltransferase [Saccharopolyspora rosea]